MSNSNNNGGCSIQIGGGYSLIMLLAGLLSWQHNHDIVWAIIHGILGIFYVIYYAIWIW